MNHRTIAALAALWACLAQAGEGQALAPLRDPWVPPAARAAAQALEAAELQPAALPAQVERKLRAAFDAADTQRTGSITLAQARAAQLGYVAENFAAIDTSHAGRVTFDDVKRFLRARGARTL